ncbi:FabD/lysophospholipase-like protein [Mycena sanguinolenta]|uniref:FabD/lysophospholipase-like protein n=1 Tax=Mycena sanguinolenta TaxID=230812 RepID=A0A8H6Z247_9AGAR|nr:FabD/lysophospholipase-like protein [Mycena sanguinolenta]
MSSKRPSNAVVSQNSQPQVVNNITYNTSIYGGQGGSGGQGGEQGGSGGAGEGPIVHQNFPSSAVVHASQLLNHCPPPSRMFHGRRTILDAMHEFFAQNTGKQRIYVLYGLGGAGKTQVALKFIEEWTNFTDQFFMDASATETIETGIKNMAATKQAGTSVQDALSWLINNQGEWLLLFDNADDPEINLNQFFPKCNHGNIIITSRNPNLRVYGAHSQVSDMEESDAVILLLKSAQQEASETNQVLALYIVKTLWYLPLAIVQAGAFILESGTLDTYLDLFIQNRTELLKKRSTQNQDDYAWAVYTTWEMSFSKLSQTASMLLQLCSFLHWDDIFEEIFSRAANRLCKQFSQSKKRPGRLQKLKAKVRKVVSLGSSQPENLLEVEITKAKEFLSQFAKQTGEWDSLQFLNIINEIRAYSLINFDEVKKIIFYPSLGAQLESDHT